MILTDEEIARRRRAYDTAKRMPGLQSVPNVFADDLLGYLDEIEARGQTIEDLKNEVFELRHASGKRIEDLLKSLDDTLKVLRQFAEVKSAA